MSEDVASALQSNNKNSKCKDTNDADSGLEESIKTTYMPDQAEEASSLLKSHDKFQKTVVEV